MISKWAFYLAAVYGAGSYSDQNYNAAGAIIVGPITIPPTGNVTLGNTPLPVTGPTFLGIVAALLLASAAGIAWSIWRRRYNRA